MAIALSKLIDSIPAETEISGLALDSRLVKPGDLFFAFQGSQVDGKLFIAEAMQKGASAVLVDADHLVAMQDTPIFFVENLRKKIGDIAAKFYHYPSQKMQMIGVTGTNGKTSCTHFIACALKQLNKACGVVGTLGSGLYGQPFIDTLTTPDPVTLQKTLADFLQKKASHVAMEVSSHSLDQDRIVGIHFAVALFTNLTRDHLDYHGTMEAYGRAKQKLFENFLVDHAVVNYDDAFGRHLLDVVANKSAFAYSLNPQKIKTPLIYAKNITLDLHGIRATVVTPWGEGELHSQLVGQFNLSNLLGVLTTLCLLDIPLATVLQCLSHLRPVPGRMQTLGGGEHPVAVVDYSHTPDSLEKALSTLRENCQGKLYCVFGCGGDRDRGKRPVMAKIAESFADEVILTDDNPRFEDPAQIFQEVMAGFNDTTKVIAIHDRAKAITSTLAKAKKGDCVLIAGKGAEMYQIIKDEKRYFSDVKVVQDFFG